MSQMCVTWSITTARCHSPCFPLSPLRPSEARTRSVGGRPRHRKLMSTALLMVMPPVHASGDEVEVVANGGRSSSASPSLLPKTGEPIIIRNSEGERLNGLLQQGRSSDLCILCHGFCSSKNSKTLSAIEGAMLDSGLSTCKFDFSGNGESEGAFSYANYMKEVEDLKCVISYWRQRGRNIYSILGHSKGGNIVLLYTSKYGDVLKVINICGRFHMENGIKERLGQEGLERIQADGYYDVKESDSGVVSYRVTQESLHERRSLDMAKVAQAIPSNCRVLIVHGEEDDTVPSIDAQEFASGIANNSLKLIAGADHNFRRHRDELVNHIIDFLSEGRSLN
eukprot:SM000072S21205  [mRNA]  locus=s72:314713:316876:+ [translate_table: standard]